MAKNTKRQVSFTSTPTTGRRSVTSRPSSEFNPDYTLVKKDLKVIGYQVIFFVGVLIVLSFILR
ncbi:MAG: hypothetical protein GX577_04125 [Leptolinea sp.]|nr:hypothetical protein [Leptolinea sp.]